MKVSLATTAEYAKLAADSIKDLNPNAADILITSVLTSMATDLGVVSPTSSGLLTYYDGSLNKANTIDGYFVAPASFNGNDHEEHRISLTYGGYVETCKGANTFAVPGIYKLLDFVFQNYASLPLKILFEYPINTLKIGFKLSQPTKDYFVHSLKPLFSWHNESKSTLAPIIDNIDDGLIKIPKLSSTYEQMSIVGFNDFYIGDINNEISSTLEDEGGHATKDDFKNYELIEGSMFKTNKRGITIIGHKGPSIGGLMVLKYLNAFSESADLSELKNIYIERKKRFETFKDRQQLVADEINTITQSPSTIQVSTSDDRNNHFSITFSSGYGSGVLCKNTGMYFNNSLGEIELNPQGFLGETYGERLISNMSPLILILNNENVAIGSPGADRISSSLAQVVNHKLENKSWKDSIDHARYHVNEDGIVKAEPEVNIEYDDINYTEEFDMYFGGVCVSGLKNTEVFAYGDKRRSDISWIN